MAAHLMNQWEYRVVVLSPAGDGRILGTGGMLYNWVVTYTAQVDAGAVKTDANSYLEFLGQSGWELVSSDGVSIFTSAGTAAPGLTLTFRRPKA
jgi:hypothetical protein